jgi:hypothetical protein
MRLVPSNKSVITYSSSTCSNLRTSFNNDVILIYIYNFSRKNLNEGDHLGDLGIDDLRKDYHLVEAHVAGGRLVSSDDPYSYAGGSVISWQGHPNQTGQRVGARLVVIHWSSKLGVGRGANNSTP